MIWGLVFILFSLLMVFGFVMYVVNDLIVFFMVNVEGFEVVYYIVKSVFVKDYFDLMEKLDMEFSDFEVLMVKYKIND